MNKTSVTKSDQETRKLASEYASTLRGGEVVALVGELGTGKTTFVSGIAGTLKCRDRVRSPSFTLVNIYKCTDKKIKEIIHVDLYRLLDQEEFDYRDFGLEDYVGRRDVVIFVEWPGDTGWLTKMFGKVIKIYFTYIDLEKRKIEFEK